MKKIAMVSFLVLTLAFVVAADSSVRTAPQSSEIVPGQFIIVLHDDVANPADVAHELSARHGLIVGHTYRVALKGFSAHIPAQRLWAVESDPRVRFIEPDRIAYAIQQETPTGVDRIDADSSPAAKIDGYDDPMDVDIAIIDTGISTHRDLNCYRGANFTNTKGENPDGNDDNGHGSHVAGTAAAIDDGIGVVGVAPGARLWSVKVLDSTGSGDFSWVIAGIDWVTERADEIDVANMSLSGTGKLDSLRLALQNSVAAGVFYAVAAGNDRRDVYGRDRKFGTRDDIIPAAYPEVAAVSAMADSDGQPGGGGEATSYGADDTFASFSNFSRSVVKGNPVNSPGAAIDLAAPGVDIYSTYLGDGYETGSGTSMASPHVAGAAALYISVNRNIWVNGKPTNAADVAAVRQALIDIYSVPQDGEKGFTGDPDANPEPLLNVAGLGGEGENTPPTAVIDSITPNPATQGEHTVVFSGSGTDSDGDIVAYEWTSNLEAGVLSTQASFSKPAIELTVGTHTISFEVQDDDGAWSEPATDTLEIIAGEGDNTPPTAYIDSIQPNPATQGEHTVVFSGSGTDSDGSVVAYEWTSNLEGGVLSTDEDFSKPAIELTVGTHTISFEVQDDDGAWSEPATDTLEIIAGEGENTPPTAQIDLIDPNPATEGQEVHFIGSGTDSDGDVVAYKWTSNRDGFLSDLADFTTSGLSVGRHTISFEVQDDDGSWSAPATRKLMIKKG